MSEKQSSPSSQVQNEEPKKEIAKKEETKLAKIFTPDEVKKNCYG